MKVRVTRLTIADFNELVAKLGIKPRYFNVPSTRDGVSFHGVYTSKDYNEVAVAWPIDRTEVAQTEYADVYKCGFPVDEFEIHDTLNGKGH